MNISLPHSTGISCIFEHEDCTTDSWVSQIGAAQFEVHSPILHQDYVAFVGSNSSYAKITYGGTSGGNATNSNYCIRYVVLKNLSGVYANWKTIIGNETGDTYCSTIAMSSNGNIQFTRQDITTSYSCSEWHVVCWTSDKVNHTNTLWIDGIKVGTSSGCNGWGADTYLAKGSSWGYNDNDTAFKCFIIGDSIPSDSDIADNINYLRTIYGLKWYLDTDNRLNHADLGIEISGDNFTPEYPATFWRVSDNKLTLNSDDWSPIPDEIPGGVLTPPYPASFWYMDSNNKLNLALLLAPLPLGAFASCSHLTTITLPESLISIGEEAFAESGLRSVTIPNSQCTYYATSFPPSCVVTGGHLIE